MLNKIPGHWKTLQILDLLKWPTQYSPPFIGDGLLQYRYWLCSPPPHGREHSSQGIHPPNPPWTFKLITKNKFCFRLIPSTRRSIYIWFSSNICGSVVDLHVLRISLSWFNSQYERPATGTRLRMIRGKCRAKGFTSYSTSLLWYDRLSKVEHFAFPSNNRVKEKTNSFSLNQEEREKVSCIPPLASQKNSWYNFKVFKVYKFKQIKANLDKGLSSFRHRSRLYIGTQNRNRKFGSVVFDLRTLPNTHSKPTMVLS